MQKKSRGFFFLVLLNIDSHIYIDKFNFQREIYKSRLKERRTIYRLNRDLLYSHCLLLTSKRNLIIILSSRVVVITTCSRVAVYLLRKSSWEDTFYRILVSCHRELRVRETSAKFNECARFLCPPPPPLSSLHSAVCAGLGNVGLACLYFLRGSLLSTCGRSEITSHRPRLRKASLSRFREAVFAIRSRPRRYPSSSEFPRPETTQLRQGAAERAYRSVRRSASFHENPRTRIVYEWRWNCV